MAKLVLDLDRLGGDLRTVAFADLVRLIAHANAEEYARNREREHIAHLRLTSDSPHCAVCRNAARVRHG